MHNRTNQILEWLAQEQKLEVSELADRLGVSQVTVRKDLDALESRGIVKREHGYALLNNPDDINGRIAIHYEKKRKIAEKASEYIKDNDTIMVENGSTCALLMDVLAERKRDLTVITNNVFIADYIRGKSNFHIILLGGAYQEDSRATVGPMVKDNVENFYVDQFFIGTDGYSPEKGFTIRDQMRAQAIKDMSNQAQDIIVLTESEKFSKRGIVTMDLGGKIRSVITDSGIPEDVKADLESKDIEVIIADE